MALKKNKAIITVLLFCSTLLPTACGVYSFTGAKLPPDVKTISIQPFFDNAGTAPPNMSQLFTEKVKDYYQRNTSLTLVKENGDLQLEGAVVSYLATPVAPTGNEVAAKMRLTITIQVKYINTKDEEQNFERSFSFFDDYDQTQSLSQVEQRLIETITDQIVLDMFNNTVANW